MSRQEVWKITVPEGEVAQAAWTRKLQRAAIQVSTGTGTFHCLKSAVADLRYFTNATTVAEPRFGGTAQQQEVITRKQTQNPLNANNKSVRFVAKQAE